MTSKPSRTPAAATAPFNRRPDISREITSERISEHLAAFQAGGGTVEVLGNTPLLKRLQPQDATPEPAAPAARASRPRTARPTS